MRLELLSVDGVSSGSIEAFTAREDAVQLSPAAGISNMSPGRRQVP